MDPRADRIDTPEPAPPALTIKRRRGPPDEASFEALREQGIRLVQALSGATWTDYNLHDPGVTILEHLCYALTDLVYRAEFPVADHLTGHSGRIDYAAHALHKPAAVFVSRPTTTGDYRRALLDTILEIDNAWLSTGPGAVCDGLYHIAVKPSDREVDERATLNRARRVYLGSRNLCEDVEDVVAVRQMDCYLVAELEVGGSRDPVDIVADVYDRCATLVSKRVEFHSLEWALENGYALDDVLSTRHTRHGVLLDADFDKADRGELFVGDLLAEVKKIDGVRAVKSLALVPGKRPATAASFTWDRTVEAPRLIVPKNQGGPGSIRLSRGESEVRAPAALVREKVRRLRAGEHLKWHERQRIDALRPARSGVYRDLQRYTSIQNDFPAIYGINAHGVPASASSQQKACARQLKAYLALFEQIIANSAAQLHHLGDLFSVDGGGGHSGGKTAARTYWSQTLDDASLPGIGALYRGDVAPADLPARVFATFDRTVDRRHRVLDYLLALHGESFAQNALRHWMRYLDAQALDESLLQMKAAYLANILTIGRDRGGAFDYSRPSWDVPGNCSGFQRRVSLLLGFRYQHSRALTSAIGDAGLVPVPYDETFGAHRGYAGISFTRIDRRYGEIDPIVPGAKAGAVSLDELDLPQGIRLGDGAHISEALFYYGAELSSYGVARLHGAMGLHLAFRGGQRSRLEHGQWWLLGPVPSPDAAREAANRLRRFVIELNAESEGMHVIEHVLLRPREIKATARTPRSFYSLRLTVVFPAWTARAHDSGFRRFAEETVALNCPAHIHAQCLWLSVRKMRQFERRHLRWLEAKVAACTRQPHAAAGPVLRSASREMVAFLLRNGATRSIDDVTDA